MIGNSSHSWRMRSHTHDCASAHSTQSLLGWTEPPPVWPGRPRSSEGINWNGRETPASLFTYMQCKETQTWLLFSSEFTRRSQSWLSEAAPTYLLFFYYYSYKTHGWTKQQWSIRWSLMSSLWVVVIECFGLIQRTWIKCELHHQRLASAFSLVVANA